MKKLKLRKETLRELDGSRLGQAAGGIGPWTPVIWTIPVNQCVVQTKAGCAVATLQGCTTGIECP